MLPNGPDLKPLQFSADSVVDTVREPMLVLGADLRVRMANRSFYKTFKVTPEETVARRVYDLGDRQWDIPALRRLLEEILPTNSTFDDFEVDHDFPGIGRKHMLLNARRVFGEGDRSEFILLAIEDTTERRRAEEAKDEIESRYTSLVQNIKDHSIFMMDLQGNITTWNTEAQRIIGYEEAEIVGRNFSVIFTPEDLEAGISKRELRLATEDGRAEDERWHVRKDGSRFWALGIVTPMHDSYGKLSGFSKILRDMTDRKRAEDLLLQANRHKDVFLATLAHELRNPLAPIRNGLELLRMTDEPQIREEVRSMMERQLSQIVRLVDDLLDISRISRNKLELRKSQVELWAVIQSAVETAQPQIEAHCHTLTLTRPPRPVYLHADLVRLAQVFWNLLNNSAKYTEPGGRITLTAAVQGDQALVSIEDTGIGIPPDALPGLFEMFSQVDHNLERAQGGLGIGLALVKGLTEAHGGTVEAFSLGVGKGCKFVVRLPVSHAVPLHEKQIPDDETKSGVRGRVLVVDDNLDGAESLARLLTIMGHETRIAHDGLEAVELAAAFQPDLIVLDIGLPKLNGHDACRRIRAQPWAKHVVIVAATGWGQDDDRQRSKAAGCDHHFVKPLDVRQLAPLLAAKTR